MAATVIKIQHPNPKDPALVAASGGAFAAHGRTKGKQVFITGKVTSKDGKHVYPGTTIRGGRHWIILFEGVPEGKGYKLEVAEVKGDGAATDSSKFDVETSKGIQIQYPPSMVSICNNFTAYGTDDQVLPVTGEMSLGPNGNGLTVVGQTIQGPPATKNWVIQFTGVPDSPTGMNYTLEVFDAANDVASSTAVVVSHAECTS